jgi:nitrogen regulatory protein PII
MPGLSLIVTIVRKGWGDTVLEASVKAGAEGGTVMFGRGAGIHEKQKLLGIAIEPEKEIVLTLTASGKVDQILDAILTASDLAKPGMGISFVVPVERVVGVVHGCDETAREEPPDRRS